MEVKSVVEGDKITPLSSYVPLPLVPYVTTPVGGYFFGSIDYPKAKFTDFQVSVTTGLQAESTSLQPSRRT
jgi:hypothetical protein